MKQYISRLYPSYYFTLILVISIILVTYAVFTPYWHTNDDVGMSMIAHGYGLSMYPSAHLVFSNIIWGSIIQYIPSFGGVLGYSWATIFIIFSGMVVVLNLLFEKYTALIAILLLLILFLRPMVYPQFTIVSGIAFIVCFLQYYNYCKKGSAVYLIGFCLFGFLSFIIRFEQFILMAIVSMPLFYFITKKYSGKLLFAIVCVGFSIIFAYWFNNLSYQADEWAWFMEFRNAVGPIVNFQSGRILTESDHLLQNAGVSVNDINLLKNFFFVDKEIVNIEILRELTRSVLFEFDYKRAFINIKVTLLFFMSPNIIALTIISIGLIFICPKREIIASWSIFLVLLFVLCLLDRPALERVIFPVVMLISTYHLVENINSNLRYKTSIVLSLFLFNGMHLLSDNLKSIERSNRNHGLFEVMREKEPLIVLGATLDYESMYPVLGKDLINKPKIFGVASFMWAPFSYSNYISAIGGGFKSNFNDNGVDVMVEDTYLSRLKIYCDEHFNGSLEILDANKEFQSVLKLKCALPNYHNGYHKLVEYVAKVDPSVIYISQINNNLVSDYISDAIVRSVKIIRGRVLVAEEGSGLCGFCFIDDPIQRENLKFKNSDKIIILNKLDADNIIIKINDAKNFVLYDKMEFGSYIVYRVL